MANKTLVKNQKGNPMIKVTTRKYPVPEDGLTNVPHSEKAAANLRK